MTSTEATQALLPVTQADRERAADIAENLAINSDLFPALIRNGQHDKHPFVQSYARHRISHCLPGDVGMREALESARADVALWMREAAERSEGLVNLNLDRAAMGVENLQLREALEKAEAAQLNLVRRAEHFRNAGIKKAAALVEELSKRPSTKWGEVKVAILALIDDAPTFDDFECPRCAALTPSALSPEPVQKLHELPEGHRWCRHCEQKDPHCSVCEGVGYLPNTVAGKDTP